MQVPDTHVRPTRQFRRLLALSGNGNGNGENKRENKPNEAPRQKGQSHPNGFLFSKTLYAILQTR